MTATATAAVPTTAPDSKLQLWGGRILTALPALGLLMSAGMKFAQPPDFVKQFTEHLGYSVGVMRPLGVVELLATVLFLIPRTAVLGAVLLTGYLGGAIATHVRVGDPFVAPLLLGVLIWGGLFLRDTRLRALLPLRT
jgi:uncharacterized membrane protein YphA (DoxX/SURF4 family)